jgi:hypothetical protein
MCFDELTMQNYQQAIWLNGIQPHDGGARSGYLAVALPRMSAVMKIE